MSAVAVLTPVVVAAWPAVSAAIFSAAAQLGFSVVEQSQAETEETTHQRVELDVPNSEVVTGTLGRDQQIRLARDGFTAVFARDPRGRATVCVSGPAHTEDELRAVGAELSGRMVQQYVLTRLKTQIAERGMNLVDETVDENQSIRLTVRHWQN